MQQRVSMSRSCRARLYSLYSFAEGAQNKAASERLVDMRSRIESMLALREKGIDSLFSTLDSILPPLVASGLARHQAILLSNGSLHAVISQCALSGLCAWHASAQIIYITACSSQIPGQQHMPCCHVHLNTPVTHEL